MATKSKPRKRARRLSKLTPDPPLRLEYRTPAELAENPRNWRRHPQTQLDTLRDLIAEVGFVVPVLFNERTGRLVDGHARRKVADPAKPIPVVIGDWDEATEAKLLLTIDPVAAQAEADAGALDALMRDVQTGSQVVAEMLKELAESAGVIPGEAQAGGGGDDFDPTPEASGPTRTHAGELWVIGGKHRLLVGDCTDAANVARLMGGEKVGAVVTDPPYGMGFQSNHRKESHAAIAGDGDARLLQWACEIEARHSRYVWCRWDNLQDVPKPKSLITWGKNNWSMGDLDHEHARQTETCLFYPGPEHVWAGGRPTDLVIHARTGNDLHPTQKPVSLLQEVVGWTAGLVYDPFLGSGTTLIAAHRLGRVCYGCEIEPRYADVILKRAEAEGLDCERVE